MKRGARVAGFAAAAVLLSTTFAWLVAEGAWALWRGPVADTSLAWGLWSNLLAEAPAGDVDPFDPSSRVVRRLRTFEAILPAMQAAGVGLGNSPFDALQSDAASMNRREGDCKVQKPDLRKVVGFVRSDLFNPFDEVTFFHDEGRETGAELAAFLDRYAFRRARHGSDGDGYRLTVPRVEAGRVALVAGDSVANGAMLDDVETLASRLQQRDGTRRWVNLGVAGAKASDAACALDRARTHFGDSIDTLVYVLCENDFDGGDELADPDALVDRLVRLRREWGLARVALVYVPYIYNAVPEVTRVRGHSHFAYPTHAAAKRCALQRAAAVGFDVVDFSAIVDAESRRLGTQFGGLALYLDHVHPSPAGVERIVAALPGF